MFTFGDIFLFVIVGIVLIGLGIGLGYGVGTINTIGETLSAVIGGCIGLVLTVILIVSIGWWNTHTASGQRRLKDYQSEINNGIEREITITAEDGRLIFYYEGKVDIESNHEDNYIKFESEDGRRYIIYYGIQDTITIIEK